MDPARIAAVLQGADDYRMRAITSVQTSDIWVPQPGPQLLAYISRADETLYGGAAGGGKTDLALGLALTLHQRSIIYRREFTQSVAMEDRLRELVDMSAYNGSKRQWRNPQEFRHIIDMGAVGEAKDRAKYKGRPYDLLVFDEASEWPLEWIEYLSTWNRSAHGYRCRKLYTSNPPDDVQGEWLIDYFAPWLDPNHPNPAKPGELRWFVKSRGQSVEVPGPDKVFINNKYLTPASRTFIPAKVADNSFLAESGYAEALEALPDEMREKFLHGVFARAQGDQELQVIPGEWVKLAMDRGRVLAEQGPPEGDPDQVGVDPSRGGKDATGIARRWGNWVAQVDEYQGEITNDGPKLAALVLDGACGENTIIACEQDGIGAAAVDALRAYASDRLRAFAAGGGSLRLPDDTGLLKFANERAASWWTLREALDPQGDTQLALPPDEELRRELTAPRYKRTLRGIQIEDKDNIRKRLGRSTNKGDAVAFSTKETAPASGEAFELW